MDRELDLRIAATPHAVVRGDGVPDALRHPLTDVDVVDAFVLRVAREAVHVDHGETLLGVRREERFLARVDPRKGVEELDGCRREVHHVMVKDGRAVEDLRRLRRGRRFGFWVRLGVFGAALLLPSLSRRDGNRHRVGLEKRLGSPGDERPSVLVERRDELPDLVPFHGILHDLPSVRVEIVGPHEDLLLASRDGKRTYPGHHVADDLAGAELVYQPAVLRLESAIPVDARVVEAELAVLLVLDDVHVLVAGQVLEGKGAELAVCADVFRLADYRSDRRVLVLEDLGDHEPVRDELFAEVDVQDVADLREALRDLHE